MQSDTLVERNVKSFFMEAMCEGYVAGGKKTLIRELVGSRHIVYERGEWGLTDTYTITPEGIGSVGTTIISYDGVPIWAMQYAGRYKENALHVLKEILREAYSKNNSQGCRGPATYTSKEGWTYSNQVAWAGSFFKFAGEERLYRPNGVLAGWHTYHGESLVGESLDPKKR